MSDPQEGVPRHYWFRRKRLGWGLEPGSPEGWIATAIFVVVELGGVGLLGRYFVRTQPWILTAWAFFWIAAFLVLVIAKGERIQWPPGN